MKCNCSKSDLVLLIVNFMFLFSTTSSTLNVWWFIRPLQSDRLHILMFFFLSSMINWTSFDRIFYTLKLMLKKVNLSFWEFYFCCSCLLVSQMKNLTVSPASCFFVLVFLNNACWPVKSRSVWLAHPSLRGSQPYLNLTLSPPSQWNKHFEWRGHECGT